MKQITKPMLAGRCSDINKLKYPVLATPKLDGIRCLIVEKDGRKRAVSRNFKPIPNHFVREWLEKHCIVGFDGELVLTEGTFQDVSSAIMSREGEPDFLYQVFDWAGQPDSSYADRTWVLEQSPSYDHVEYVLPLEMENVAQLERYEEQCLTDGYEGVMVRDPMGPYKCGRSTEREGWLLKIKRFEDGDAVIIGVEEKMHNANEQMDDPLGRTKRHSFKSGMVPMNTLGALIVKDLKTNVEFRIGTGFDDAMRQTLWNARAKLNGVIVKYKSQTVGVKEKPRFPVFLGVRSELQCKK